MTPSASPRSPRRAGRLAPGRTALVVLALAGALVCVTPARASLSFGTADTLSPAGLDSGEAALAVDEAGKAAAVWLTNNAADRREVWAAVRGTGAWGPARKLSSGAFDVTSADVAIDTSGNAIAVWSDNDNREVDASYRPAAGDWGPVEPIDTVAVGSGLSKPVVALDSSGQATVAYRLAPAGKNAEIWAARRSAGSWGEPVRISPQGPTFDDDHIAVDLQGDVAVAWATGGASGIWVAERAAGATAWRAPALLSSGVTGPHVSLAKDPLTDATAVGYCEHPQPLMSCYPTVRVRSAGNPFGDPVPLTSNASGSTPLLAAAGINPSPAGADGGTFLTIFAADVGQYAWTNRSPDTDWTTAKPLADRPEVLAMNEEGHAVAAFRNAAGTGPMRAIERIARGTWSSAVDVPGAADDTQPTDIGIDRAGHPTLIWTQTDANGRDRVLANEGAGGAPPPGPPPPGPAIPSVPAPLPPPGSPDTLGDLGNDGSQPIGDSVSQSVTCSEDCTASASGTVSVPGAARVYRLKKSKTVRISAHHRATLKLRIPPKARRAAVRALRRHRKVVASIRVLVRPAAGGPGRALSKKIRLRAPWRRH